MMDALKAVSPSSNILLPTHNRCNLPTRSFSSTTSFLRPPPPAPSIASRRLPLTNPILLQHTRNWSISSSSSSLSAPSQVVVETVDSQPQAEYATKTVHVRFQLQKACSYGEMFLLSGDDPIFGLWRPSNAIPLNWSDGHVWSIELDLPVGRTIQYKFILKCNDGEIKWQPGPDRIIKTWETSNTVIVSEDWRFVRLQKITEVEAMADGENRSSVFQENGMATPIDRGMDMKEEELLIARGEAFTKEVPSIMYADAYVVDDDEEPTELPV